ncbi:hypothetical protein AH4AK4_0177 [Aeromonas hydrophila 4AK4]|nr:hypothetical protein AH4AK4_0177 [Aeromonas hydrophila 4AK4]
MLHADNLHWRVGCWKTSQKISVAILLGGKKLINAVCEIFTAWNRLSAGHRGGSSLHP